MKKRIIAGILGCLLFMMIGSLVSCQKREKTEKLQILIDILCNNPLDDRSPNDEINEFLPALEYTFGIDRDSVEIVHFSKNKEERAAEIAAMRTEIMAGGGPDVFLLPCTPPGWREKKERWYTETTILEQFDPEQALFINPTAAMNANYFLPLDPYLTEAKFFNPALVNQTVLAAGKTEDGQIILPLAFTFPTANLVKDVLDFPNELPTTWEEAVTKEEGIRNAYGFAAWEQFSDIFGSLADYSTEELSFSREELLQKVRMAVKMQNAELISCETDTEKMTRPYKKAIREVPVVKLTPNFNTDPFPPDSFCGFLSIEHLDFRWLSRWEENRYDCRWKKSAGTQMILPIRNKEGGVTAGITAYACINRNTKRPEDAFRVLDFLYNDDVQRHWTIPHEYDPEQDYCPWIYEHTYGLPMENERLADFDSSFIKDYIARYSDSNGNNLALFSEYTALRSEVTHARFYGTLDQELQTMYEACLEAKTDEEIEKIVAKAYDTMEMILAES